MGSNPTPGTTLTLESHFRAALDAGREPNSGPRSAGYLARQAVLQIGPESVDKYDVSVPTPAAQMNPPSRLWKYAVVALFLAAIGVAGYAWLLAERARQPIGEGALFVDDMKAVVGILEESSEPPDHVVRLVRNELEVEAVSLLGRDGFILASSSDTLIGHEVSSEILRQALGSDGYGDKTPGRFAAVAEPLAVDLEVDGMEMWSAGDVVYQVAQPLDEGAVLVSYDMSELLARRSLGREIPQRAFDLFLVAGLLSIAGATAMTARSRVVRAYDVFSAESRLLREHAESLEFHNVQLDAARRSAERALELAEEKNRIRSEFVLMINHELRTPLTGVVSGAELARDMAGDDITRGLLEDVVGGARRLEEMIGEMLVVARIENRGLFVNPVPNELGGIVSQMDSLSPDWNVTIDPALDPSTRILTDATTLPRLIGSLAANSFTHGATRIVVRCLPRLPFVPQLEVGERPPEGVYFVVADDGPGIDEEFLPRAFEKFEKRSFSSGTGLGLYLAKMMIEALGGSISVVSGPHGTAMAVGTPLAREMEAAL